jgi:hypothetical protein
MALIYDMLDLLELRATIEKLDALFIRITGSGLNEETLTGYMGVIEALIEKKENEE